MFQKLQRFLYGRYGTDSLNLFLLITGLVIYGVGSLFFWPLTFLADALYVWALFRTFSRNIPARQRELGVFMKFWRPVGSWFRVQKQRFALRKTYKYFRCPSCRQQLRAPRGRGKIQVTCQKCHAVFQTKT